MNISSNETIFDRVLDNLKDHSFDAHFTAIFIVWILIAILILCNCMCVSRQLLLKIYGKGVRKEDLLTHRYKYLLQLIFSNPRRGFDLSNSKIHIEIIHDNTRYGKFDIDSDFLQTNRYGCIWIDIRAHILYIRRKPMPSINSVHGFHRSTPNSKIFFEGIECLDLKTGERVYYPVEEFLVNEEATDSSDKLDVKEQNISCCSVQTLFPGFIPLLIEDFGKDITTGDQIHSYDKNGILLSPKLHWFESVIFCSLFLNLSFVITIGLLYHTKSLFKNNINITSVTALLLSGFVALLITELLTIFYKRLIKRFYNKHCSEMRTDSGTASKCWAIIRYFYMFLVFVLSVLSSLSMPIVISINKKRNQDIAKEYGFDLFKKNPKINELLFLLVFLSASILLSLTVWLLLLSVIRYLIRSCAGRARLESDIESDREKRPELKNNKIQPKAESPKKQSPKETQKTTMSPTERKTINAEKTKESETKKIDFNTEMLEKDLNDKRRTLTTNTVIAKPTKSLGFINPEAFRLTESRADLNLKTDRK